MAHGHPRQARASNRTSDLRATDANRRLAAGDTELGGPGAAGISYLGYGQAVGVDVRGEFGCTKPLEMFA